MMKKTFHIVTGLLFNTIIAAAQTIPTGISADSIYAKEIYSTNNILEFFYYKPVSYDPLTSPLLFAIHGDGDNGTGSLGVLENIAERRKALVIAPNVGAGNFRNGEPVYNFWDTLSQPNADCESNGPTSEVFKQVYRHILAREKRASMPTYLIGFSAGGQFVTRYMLLRQAYSDSIPLRMAVSTNPYFYTFPTDTFNHVPMPWMCGLWFTGGFPYSDTMYIQYINKYCPMAFKIYDFGCREDIIQYYNENYAVLIGTGDTQNLYDTLCPCALVQGTNRYQRAKTFYAFCDTDAVHLGTTLKWQYAEVPGVGHDIHAMYNTILAGDSMPLAERLLFETPYHNVPRLAPLAGFYADNDTVYLPEATVNFINTSSLAASYMMYASYLWDFGDSTTSTQFQPSHTYTKTGRYSVQLTVTNSAGCGNWNVKRYYIVVLDITDVKNMFASKNIKVYPSPATDNIIIENTSFTKGQTISVYDIQGQLLLQQPMQQAKTNINIAAFAKGIYFIKVENEKGIAVNKFVKD